jgi:hypothetical protein
MAFDDNLQARYALNGGTYTDASPNSNDLSASASAPTQTEGFGGTANAALSFNGTNNYLEIVDGSQTGLDSFAACTMIFRLSPTTHSVNNTIVSKYGSANQLAYRVQIDTAGKLHVLMSSNGTSYGICNVTSSFTIDLDRYGFYGFTYDGSSVAFYKNGFRYNTETVAGGTVFDSTDPFRIGDNAVGTLPYNGSIDDVEVWSRALTYVEMEYSYNRTDNFSTAKFATPLSGYSSVDTREVSEGSGGELTNYQVLIPLQGNTPEDDDYLDFTSLDAYGNGIRLTLDNGRAILPHYVEAFDLTAKTATLWVKLPILEASGTKNLKLHSVNASALQSSNLPDTMIAGLDSKDYGFRRIISAAAGSGQGSKQLWAPIVVLGNGDWLCAYNDGDVGTDEDDTRVVMRTSSDQGDTWSSLSEIASATYHCGEPVLFVDPADDKVWCFYDEFIATASDGGTLKYKTSTDHGATWSSATSITTTDPKCVPGTFLETEGGTWLLAFHSFDAGARVTRVMRSTNSGSTWTEYGSIGSGSINYVEPQIVEKANNDLYITMRTDNTKIYESVSTDDGLTWSVHASTGLDTSYARHGLSKLTNGDFLICHHDENTSNAHPRNEITARISEDESSTWSIKGIVQKTINDATSTGKNGNIWTQIVDGYLVVTWVNWYDIEMARYPIEWFSLTENISLSSIDDDSYTVNGAAKTTMYGESHVTLRKSTGIVALHFNEEFDRPVIVESYHKVVATSNNLFIGDIGTLISNSAMYVFFDLPGSPGNQRGQVWDGTAQQYASENWAGALTVDTLYRSKYILLDDSGSNNWNIDTFESGNALIDVDLSGEAKADDYKIDLRLGHGTDRATAGASSAVEWIFARKWASVEPTVSLSAPAASVVSAPDFTISTLLFNFLSSGVAKMADWGYTYSALTEIIYRTDLYGGSDADVAGTELFSTNIDLTSELYANVTFKHVCSGNTDDLLINLYRRHDAAWSGNELIVIDQITLSNLGTGVVGEYNYMVAPNTGPGHYRFSVTSSGATDTFDVEIGMRRGKHSTKDT